MGKTAVFVLSTLQQIEAVPWRKSAVVVLCHTRELAHQICKEYNRFIKYMPGIKVEVFYGGVPLKRDLEILKAGVPNIIVATPGRVLGLLRDKLIDISKCKHFVLDECDKMLDALDMRKMSKTCSSRLPIPSKS